MAGSTGRGPGEPDVPVPPEVPAVPEAPRIRPDLPPHPDKGPDARMSQYQRMGLAYALPTALAAPVVGLTLLGYWLDGRYDWTPWGVVVGALLGMVTGLVNMVRMARRLDQ